MAQLLLLLPLLLLALQLWLPLWLQAMPLALLPLMAVVLLPERRPFPWLPPKWTLL